MEAGYQAIDMYLRIQMSHVTYKWVMSHTNESCHKWMSHVTNEWVTWHVNESCHVWSSHVTHRWSRQCWHTATHCNMLQHTATRCNTLQHTATHCNTLQHTATQVVEAVLTRSVNRGPFSFEVAETQIWPYFKFVRKHVHGNTRQHTATHCNTLQHNATHCNTLHHTTWHYFKFVRMYLSISVSLWIVALFRSNQMKPRLDLISSSWAGVSQSRSADLSCIYVCIHIYIYICTYVYIYIYTYLSISISISISVSIFIFMFKYIITSG